MNLFVLSLGLVLTFLGPTGHAEDHQELAPERRRPLSGQKSWLRGTDLTMYHRSTNENLSPGYCQSTLVAKKRLDASPPKCRLAYLTAAHCVDSPLDSIDFSGIGQIKMSSMNISIPPEYFYRGGQNSRDPKGGDSATLVFDVPCEKAESLVPVPLAPVNSQGQTIVDSKKVFLQKRQTKVSGNSGGGAQIQADVLDTEGAMFKFYAPSPQGYATVAGDSGGPVFNEKGELLCPISGSSYEAMRENGKLTPSRFPNGNPDKVLDPFEVSCDKNAIARLKKDLEKFGLSPISRGEAEELSQFNQ